MADLIKKIKIKKQDGTFTDYIPIGAEAQNINVDGESVAYKLNKKPYFFNTVADMKADTKLKVGDMAITLGYYSINDGGGATYKIESEESETEYQEELENELFATLIINGNIINPCQFGAKHNGVNSDDNILQFCLDILHDHKYKVLDLKGYTYYINKPLHLDSTYKATIKDGEIIALSTFELDEDINKNYLLYLTNNINEGQPGTPGYATEDLTIYNLKFDAQLIDGLGCLNARYYLRINIDNCLFRRYKTIGLNSTYQDSHEMVLTNSVFNASLKDESNPNAIGINLTGYDNMFSNIVITGGAYGIKMDNVSANTYSKIHTYGCRIYGVYMANSSQNIFEQFYFDGQGVYIHSPWLTTFINCYFLCNSTPITLDKNSGNVSVLGLKFIGCVGRNYENPTIDIISLPNGNFTNLKQCEFDISMAGNINYNVYSVVGYDNSYVNKVFINSVTQNILLNGNGVIVNSGGISGRYTYTAINNIVDVTSYDNTGDTHAGFVIPLDKNTLYKTINMLDKGQNYKIYGFNDLNQGTTGTVIKWDNASSKKYETFNSGNYDYYVVTFYGKKILQLEVSTLN